jgi:hypothetical protein
MEPGYYPPMKSSGGNFYAVAFTSAGFGIEVWKATDPTDSWTEQDHQTSIGNVAVCSAVQGGDLIHIAHMNAGVLRYTRFNMATDVFDVVNELVESTTNDPANDWCSIAVRSDGDVVVVYNGDTDANMGNQKERVDVNVRTGGTWSGPTSLDAGGDVHYGNPNCVKGPLTDDIHSVWQKTTDTANDPPTTWAQNEGRTIDPSDTLSTTYGGHFTRSYESLLGCPHMFSYDDGTQKMYQMFGRTINIAGLQTKEDGSDDISAPTARGSLTADCYINGEVAILANAELNNDFHLLFSGGGTSGADQDLYYSKSADDGISWDTPTEELDAITCNYISANIYTRGGATVLAYVYDDGGVQKYNEKVLIAAAGLPGPNLLRSFATARAANY